MKKSFFIIFILFFCFSLLSEEGIAFVHFNPAIEEEEIIFVPLEKEKNMGRNIDKQVDKHYDLPVDPLMQERIEKIGEKLAEGADRKDIVYRFRVLAHKKKDFYNAFAAPGGYVYIFEDMVTVLEDDDKIAAVLAHEIGHIEAKHSIKRLQGSLGVTALMLLGAQMNSGGSGTYAKANAAIGQLMASYSRGDERKADELSIRYMERAGFDQQGTIGALKCLKDLRKKGKLRKYSFYRSHPYLSQRIAYLNELINGFSSFNSYINDAPDIGVL